MFSIVSKMCLVLKKSESLGGISVLPLVYVYTLHHAPEMPVVLITVYCAPPLVTLYIVHSVETRAHVHVHVYIRVQCTCTCMSRYCTHSVMCTCIVTVVAHSLVL